MAMRDPSGGHNMDDYQDRPAVSLYGYWVRICDHRWRFAVFVCTGWVVATTLGLLLPPKYRSETVILVEQQKIPEHYVEPNVGSDIQRRLQTMSEQILSRTRLLAIIDKFQLYTTDRRTTDVDGLVNRMRKNIDIELIRAARDELSAFKISYSDSNPSVAQQITGELTSLFINENLRNRTQLSENTTTFLETQLTEARKSLDEQEQRLREFRSRYVGQLPEQLQGNVQILTGLQTQLQSENDTLQRSEQQRLFLQYQYRALGGGSSKNKDAGNTISVPELDQKLDNLKSQLTQLTTRYTEQHPDVSRVQNEIRATQAIRSKIIDELKNKPEESGVQSPSMVSSRLAGSPITLVEGQLKANELEIANQKAKIAKLEGQIEQYRGRLNWTPVREQQLSAVTRDYEQSRTYYDSLLAKKLQSEMATNLEKRQQGEQFRMLDPPNLPQKPYWPNRLMFSLAGLAAGAALGLFIVVVVEFISPRVYEDQELRNLDGINVLVSIPALLTQNEENSAWWSRLRESVAACIILAAVSAGTLVVYYRG
jgi:succinoglycan biosynthesis transport protein ExoP